jgi:dTDP-4-amino-4,6-dideoxygalactose transaminase
MLGTAFPPWPSFTTEEADAIRDVLLSNRVNYWTGTEGRNFETEFAAWAGAAHAVALTSGSVALDVAWKSIAIKPGDEIIVTPRSFVASAFSIVNAGGIPVFADVDPDSQNITPETAARVLTPRTRAILCVHLAGWPCDMDGFRDLAHARNLALVEDCAQAHGASYRGVSVGNIGDIAAWSFCQDKIMTTGGEGGMITTNSKGLWEAAWSYKDHGKTLEGVYQRQHPPGFRWLHESFGTNCRMMEIQAVLGRIQLRRMSDWNAARTRNAKTILGAAYNLSGLRVPEVPETIVHAWYKAYVFVRPEALKTDWSRDRIIAEISARGVPCYSGSCSETYLERAFHGTGMRPSERLPVAQALGETSLMFLVHPTLTDENIALTCDVIGNVIFQAQR